MSIQDIGRLLEEVRKLVDSHRNRQLEKIWQSSEDAVRDSWRGTPRPLGSAGFKGVPITVEPEKTMWAKILRFRVKDFYTIPEVYLEYSLKIAKYKFQEFKDDAPVSKSIDIWLGSAFEPSLFGVETVYLEDKSPWIGKNPIIKKEEDLDSLEYPDFYESGSMPLAHIFYERIRELVGEDFNVTFPCWMKGPFGTAVHLRGMKELLIDTVVRPDFVHRLMRFITESRKRWIQERAKYLGVEVGKGDLDNDEVNCPTLSPKTYQEFVLPYEKELCEFHRGISYWHSCGDTTRLLPLIKEIPELRMLHIGPWTDLSKVVEVFGSTVPFEICLHPVRDVLLATEVSMKDKLTEIIKTCGNMAYTVRADGLDAIGALDPAISQVKLWIDVAREVVEKIG